MRNHPPRKGIDECRRCALFRDCVHLGLLQVVFAPSRVFLLNPWAGRFGLAGTGWSSLGRTVACHHKHYHSLGVHMLPVNSC